MTRFLLALPLLLLAGCSPRSLDFSIDNPSDAPISVDIDGTRYEVPAHDATSLSLTPGEHRLRSAETGDVRFIVYAGRPGGIINPTLGEYVIVQQVYVTDASKLKNFGAIESTITVGGVPYTGPFTLAPDLFIDKSWDFGVHEPLPHEVRGYDPGNGGNFFKKIFDAAAFAAFFEKEYSRTGLYKGDTRITDPRAARPPPLPETLPDFDDVQLQQASMPLRELYRRYRHATDAAEQERLQKEDFELSVAFTHVSAGLLSKLGRADNEKYSLFVESESRLMSTSAVVER